MSLQQENKATKRLTHACNKCKMARAMHVLCVMCMYALQYVYYYVGQVHYIVPCTKLRFSYCLKCTT